MSDIALTNPTYAWRARTRGILGEPDLTPLDVAVAAGVELEEARRFWRALGFPPIPDDRAYFTTMDVTMLRAVRSSMNEGRLDPAVGQQLTRVAGQAFSRLAEAHVAATVERLLRADATTPLGMDDALWTEIDRIVHSFEPFLTYIWRRHLLVFVCFTHEMFMGQIHSCEYIKNT